MNNILRRRAIQGIPEDTVSILERYLALEAIEDNTSFTFTNSGLEYSIDEGDTWIQLEANTGTPAINSEEKIYFRGNLSPTSTGIGKFSSTSSKQFNAMGNIMSLLYGDRAYRKNILPDCAFYDLFFGSNVYNAENLILPLNTSFRCYRDMFLNCTRLIKGPDLPAKELSELCYLYMFWGCTSLIEAPVLPATELTVGCYSYMFNGCTSLVNAPELPATTLAESCYSNMFLGCTSLTTASELPATTLAIDCYKYMFMECTSLTTAPELPATTLADECYYNMFASCTLLTGAPKLPATTLAISCYEGMFLSCSSLTRAPILRAISLERYCYRYMFKSCSILNYIKAMFTTTPGNSYTYNWVNGVSSTGTFVKNRDATWNVTGNNGVPSGWTVETASE